MRSREARTELMAERLKSFRSAAGLSQAKLRQALNEKYAYDENKTDEAGNLSFISQDSLNKYEKADFSNLKMTVETLAAFADFYETNTDYLLGLIDDSGEKPVATEQLQLSESAIRGIKLITSDERIASVFDRILSDNRLYSAMHFVRLSEQQREKTSSSRLSGNDDFSKLPEGLKEQCMKYDVVILDNVSAAQHYEREAAELLIEIFRTHFKTEHFDYKF